jgi:hypothetical protein
MLFLSLILKLEKMKTIIDDKEIPDREHMKTMASVINSLTKNGYETQFKVLKEGLKSLATEKVYKPEEVKISNFYRFEGDSDPADNSILYVIDTVSGEKGTLTDAYGAYSDAQIHSFVKEVEEIQKREHKKGKE